MPKHKLPASLRLRKRDACAAAILISIATPGCGEELGEPVGNETDAQAGDGLVCAGNNDCDGVKVWCLNAEAADESGGGEERNYFWSNMAENNQTPCAPLDSPPTSGCNGEEWCCPYGLASGCFCKHYTVNYTGDPGVGDMPYVCVDESFGMNFSPLGDWESVFNPYPEHTDVNDAVRDRCSERCQQQTHPGLSATYPPLCEDANWSGLRTAGAWNPMLGPNCNTNVDGHVIDPDGSNVPWDLVGGPSSPVPLSCDLTDGTCADLFVPSARRYLIRNADFIDPETSSAHYLAIEGTGSELAIDTWCDSRGCDDTEPLVGFAEYSLADPGSEDVVPFFLANFHAFGPDTWDIAIETPTTTIRKMVSNVTIDLLQSTLGIYNTNLQKVAFAPGTLHFRIEIDVSSCGACDHFGDGMQSKVMVNDEYVFADFVDGELDLVFNFDFQSTGSATLTLNVVPDEYPPTAAHDLQAIEECDQFFGLTLDSSRSVSTDPDSDIVLEYWFVDGENVGFEGVVPLGSHSVALWAEDSRGAVHVSDEHWIYVQGGNQCLALEP